jgi:glycosyltransferase involved in cell wall biosynthesis
VLLERGVKARFVLVGDGPQRAEAAALAARAPQHLRFTGAIAYEAVPAELLQASVGVAPFNTAPHPALRAAGFFWSPLKIFEYMAASLPVVTADIAPLNRIVRHGHEGLLFREGDMLGLAEALARLLQDPTQAQRLGAAGRARVVAHYSWQQHCAALEAVMHEINPMAD